MKIFIDKVSAGKTTIYNQRIDMLVMRLRKTVPVIVLNPTQVVGLTKLRRLN